MHVEHIASVQSKSVIVLTAGLSIEAVIGWFSALILRPEYTASERSQFLGHFRKIVHF